MKTFTYIAHKLFIRDVKYKPDINFDTYETYLADSIRHISYIEHIFSDQNNLHVDFMKCLFVLSNEPKFKELDKNIGDKFFISSENQILFLNFFSEVQKVYWAFANFAKRIKQRYSKNKVDRDLLLTPISITQRNIIQIYENNYKYLFTLQDLSHIIITAICNSPSFHSEPLNPKNPYSGVAFSKTNLYNIYFYMKERFSIVPEVIHKFFLTDFDIELFGDKYKLIIRDIFINQFVDNEDKDEIVENIYDMINEFYTQLKIHEDFPDDILINTFKSALINYLHYKYNFDLSKRSPNYRLMSKKMNHIIKKCPGIGRKILVIKDKKRYTAFITLDGRTEPVLRVPPLKSVISDMDISEDDELHSDISNNSTDISNNLFQEFSEHLSNRLDELIRETDIPPDYLYDTDYIDSDDEIEYDESLYDP